ncbi:fatty acid desaturase [Paenibacillus sp. LMG 31461]|uniref:Fatty acid desaturase n=1 Tax=Paenibacillus plantarum TaxID=2654975 RepID=A0ABX1X4L6_9BACL|nr:fatty acid desaturase [Paenibacillus plantarum]NOU63249.1 fatty acid desaturase [Paenibacillus plantarum]
MRKDELIPGIDITKLSELKVRYFIFKILTWFLILLTGWWLIATTNLFLMLLGYFLVGAMFVHGVELQHQCLHNTGLKKKKLNRILGFILGLPMFVSFSDYKYHHIRHHRLLGTPENKEFFNYGGSDKIMVGFLYKILMIGHYIQTFKSILDSCTNKIKERYPENVGRKVQKEYLLFLAILFGAHAISIIFNNSLLIHYWFFPLLFAVPLHALVELPEHEGCITHNPDVLVNTRTIKSNKFVTWFTNSNNYHVEHHLLPSVPMENLEEVHNLIQGKEQYLNITYREFYYEYFKELIRNSFEIKSERK